MSQYQSDPADRSPIPPTDSEDLKIIALARAARARTESDEGACVRDTDGRTYAATSIVLPSLRLSAIALAVAMAVSSGATGLEAVALVSDSRPTEADLAIVRDLPGTGVTLWYTDANGNLRGLVELDDKL